MQKDFTWQQVQDLSTLSRGLVLSATDNFFIIKNIQDNTILQELPIHDFISDFCKYPCEIFNLIQKKLSCSFDDETIFFDNVTAERISQLSEANCLLF